MLPPCEGCQPFAVPTSPPQLTAEKPRLSVLAWALSWSLEPCLLLSIYSLYLQCSSYRGETSLSLRFLFFFPSLPSSRPQPPNRQHHHPLFPAFTSGSSSSLSSSPSRITKLALITSCLIRVGEQLSSAATCYASMGESMQRVPREATQSFRRQGRRWVEDRGGGGGWWWGSRGV